MYTLVKLGLWFGLVLFFMPLGNGNADSAPQVSAVQALYAAKEAVEDVRGICDRQPRVCDTGSAAFHKIGMTAREGARMAFNYLDARYGEEDAVTGNPVPQETVPAEAKPAE